VHPFTPGRLTTHTHTHTHTAGAFSAGLINEAERFDIVRNSCPGAGACGGMYTANTMASAIEALGMALPYDSSIPAEDPLKIDE
jgi:dihydroxy-acid dehydratase